MTLLRRGSFVFLAGLALLMPTRPAPGQAPAFQLPADAAGRLAAWNKLLQDRETIGERLQKLEEEYQTAEPDRQAAIEKEHEQISEDFVTRMKSLAPAVYADDPTNAEAGQSAMIFAYSANRFDVAAKIGDKLMVSPPEDPIVPNITAVSHFATHDFQKAREMLSDLAQKQQLIPRLAAEYLEPSAAYVDLWKKEQAIRAKETSASGDQQLPRVELKTNRGTILIELLENEAPNTVANFVSLVEGGKYNGTKFHRVIDQFMIQGGDPNSLNENPADDGTGGPGYTIECECFKPDARMHFQGSLSMAHAGKDTGGSQFFITHLPTPHLNPNPNAGTGHTVFGRVLEGMDVVASIKQGDKIETAKVVRKRNHPYKPVTHAEKQ